MAMLNNQRVVDKTSLGRWMVMLDQCGSIIPFQACAPSATRTALACLAERG